RPAAIDEQREVLTHRCDVRGEGEVPAPHSDPYRPVGIDDQRGRSVEQGEGHLAFGIPAAIGLGHLETGVEGRQQASPITGRDATRGRIGTGRLARRSGVQPKVGPGGVDPGDAGRLASHKRTEDGAVYRRGRADEATGLEPMALAGRPSRTGRLDRAGYGCALAAA